MDANSIFRILVGVMLILGGLAYIALRTLADIDGDPDEGPLAGWGPVVAGLGVVVLGGVILALPLV